MLNKTSVPYLRSVSIWKISSNNKLIRGSNNTLHHILPYLRDKLLTDFFN